jgi:hypothetical protein
MKKRKTLGKVKSLLKEKDGDLDIYFKYYLGEVRFEDLSPLAKIKLERYNKAWSWYCMGRTKPMIIAGLKADYDIESRQAEYDFAVCIRLFGHLDQVDKDGRRVASVQYYDMLSLLAVKEKQYDVAVKARKEADILSGVYDNEDEGWGPEEWKKPTKVVYVVVGGPAEREIEEGSAEVIALDE